MFRCPQTYGHILYVLHPPSLTSPPLLQPSLPFLLPQPRLLLLLLLATLVKVFHHHADKHVEHKEADDEEERDKKQQHPRVVVSYWLQRDTEREFREERRRGSTGTKRERERKKRAKE